MTAVIVRRSLCKSIYFLNDQINSFCMFLVTSFCFLREKQSTVQLQINLMLFISICVFSLLCKRNADKIRERKYRLWKLTKVITGQTRKAWDLKPDCFPRWDNNSMACRYCKKIAVQEAERRRPVVWAGHRDCGCRRKRVGSWENKSLTHSLGTGLQREPGC